MQIIDCKCDDGFVWNPSTCEYDKSCDNGEHLDYENCKCKKRLIDKLVEECGEDVNGNETIYNVTLNDHRIVCNSCTTHIVLLIITSMTLMDIVSVYVYFY